MFIATEFFAVPDAARALGYTVQHTRLLLRRGELVGVKVGRDWVVLRESVADYNAKKGTVPLLPQTRRGRPPSGHPYGIDFSHRDSKL